MKRETNKILRLLTLRIFSLMNMLCNLVMDSRIRGRLRRARALRTLRRQLHNALRETRDHEDNLQGESRHTE